MILFLILDFILIKFGVRGFGENLCLLGNVGFSSDVIGPAFYSQRCLSSCGAVVLQQLKMHPYINLMCAAPYVDEQEAYYRARVEKLETQTCVIRGIPKAVRMAKVGPASPPVICRSRPFSFLAHVFRGET